MLLADGVPADRTVTVHEGIDVSHILAAPPVNVHEALWLPHHAPLVGNVAALVPHKGQRYLIEAAHLVVREMPDARFVIFGEGELREHLERLVHEHQSREARAAAGISHRHSRLHQGLRRVRDELGDRGPRHVAARRHGLPKADRGDARPAAFRRSSRTASTVCWSAARRGRRSPARS